MVPSCETGGGIINGKWFTTGEGTIRLLPPDTIESDSGINEIINENEERDLGVLFNISLLVSSCCRCSVESGYEPRNNQKIVLTIGEEWVLQLYKTIVRPTLKYCNSLWCPLYNKNEDLLEKVEQRVTRLLPDSKHLDYPDRLRGPNLPTLVYRRQRAELIQIFNIMQGIDQLTVQKLK